MRDTPEFIAGDTITTPFGEGKVDYICWPQHAYRIYINGKPHGFTWDDVRLRRQPG